LSSSLPPLSLSLSLSLSPVFPYRKGGLPPPPRMSKPIISVRAQSSTESTQDTYFQNTGQPALGRPRQHHSHSVDLGITDGRSTKGSREGGYYTGPGQGRSRQHSNSAESLDGNKTEGRGRNWRPSIAVQVDSPGTLTDSDAESKALREVHSIGVQVEEDKRYCYNYSLITHIKG
ncbi:unnamed protein product, partial [Oncorhynchus mykiss]